MPIVLVVMMVHDAGADAGPEGHGRRTPGRQLEPCYLRPSAAESLVRYCEARLFANGFEQARFFKQDPNRLMSENFQSAAWASNLNANQYITIAANLLPPGATAARCVIEDATSELLGGVYEESENPGSGAVDRYLWKYRITVATTFSDATVFGNVTYRAQSEVRFLIP